MVRTILALAFLIGIILLQVFLSQTERKWPGLILPIISFLFGFLYPFNMSAGTLIWQVFLYGCWGIFLPFFFLLSTLLAAQSESKRLASKCNFQFAILENWNI